MATVNFQCGHCQKLMAVGQEHLGQQVRCPHCQQVVLAPAPPPASAALTMDMPMIEVPRLEEHDSIFTPPEASQDDLFGEAPVPRIEIPTEPAYPLLGLEEPTVPSEPSAPAPGPVSPMDVATTTAAVQPAAELPPTEVLSADAAPVRLDAGPLAPTQEESPPVEDESSLAALAPRKPRVGRSNPWVIPLIIAPLAFYSFMATLYILDTKYLHFFTPPPPPHPLEILPDLEGDNHGTAKRGKQSSLRPVPASPLKYKGPDPDQPLPAKLRVGLGKTLAIGDLEVTPIKVERRRPVWSIGKSEEPFAEDVLSLTLQLRNRSAEVTFHPMDRYFARKWPTTDSTQLKPYTFLEVGEQKYYGGPLDWVPLAKAHKEGEYIHYVKGQNVDEELKPGQEMTTFFCTDPERPVLKAVERYRGTVVWRLHLRRGLVQWTTRKGVERDDPATAVVGVEFTAADVKNATD